MIDRETLYDLYWNKGLTQQQIAKKQGISQSVISKLMAKFGIKRRNNKWTKEELTTLHKLYPSTSQEEIVKAIPRHNWNAIKIQAQKNGLNRNITAINFRKPSYLLSDLDLGYIAGFVDGEGCFRFHYDKGSSYRPEIVIVNTNKEVLKWIKNKIGGRLDSEKRYNNKWKALHRLVVGSIKNVYFLLKKLEPHLKVKRKQANLMLKFCELRLNCNSHGEPYTERELQIINEMKALNKKGNIYPFQHSEQVNL
jgi:hypothetical protein